MFGRNKDRNARRKARMARMARRKAARSRRQRMDGKGGTGAAFRAALDLTPEEAAWQSAQTPMNLGLVDGIDG